MYVFVFGIFFFFFFNDTATTEIYTLSLHDALPIWAMRITGAGRASLQATIPRVLQNSNAVLKFRSISTRTLQLQQRVGADIQHRISAPDRGPQPRHHVLTVVNARAPRLVRRGHCQHIFGLIGDSLDRVPTLCAVARSNGSVSGTKKARRWQRPARARQGAFILKRA